MGDGPPDPAPAADGGRAAASGDGKEDPRATDVGDATPGHTAAREPADAPASDAAERSTAATGDPAGEDGSDDREGGAIFESGGPAGPIEPGTPTLEGTLFVLLGALIAGGMVLHLWLLFN